MLGSTRFPEIVPLIRLLTGCLIAFIVPSQVLAADPQGVWLTEKSDAAVAIAPCGDRLCGRIVWLKDATDESGQPRRDGHNPDPAKRDRQICGLVVMEDFKSSAPDIWGGGIVYNPMDGRFYSGEMVLRSNNTLKVQAYLGMPFFGQSQIWTRAERTAAGLVKYNCRFVRPPRRAVEVDPAER